MTLDGATVLGLGDIPLGFICNVPSNGPSSKGIDGLLPIKSELMLLVLKPSGAGIKPCPVKATLNGRG